MKKWPEKGFSLLEVMVSLLIFSLLLGALFGIFSTGNKFWVTFQDKSAIQQELRRAVYAMTRELREAKGVLVTKEADATTIRFERPQKGVISYIYSATGPDSNRIVRRNNSNSRILANDVSALAFDYQDNSIFLDVTATRHTKGNPPVSFRMKEKITLRQ